MKVESLLQSALGGTSSLTGKTPSTSNAFSDMVTKALSKTADTQKHAEVMTQAAAAGENVPMHEVIQAVSEAELTLQTMLTVRDKAVEAYQEILRMPI
tara:strand:+ start:3711 stop:4004 length:294 start_codon:yes stop_codon:yes gene_type:complete